MEPASTIIEVLGGPTAVAAIVDRDVSSVHRWTYPKERGGLGGNIPRGPMEMILRYAREKRLPIRPEHFFLDAEGIRAALPVPGEGKRKRKAAEV